MTARPGNATKSNGIFGEPFPEHLVASSLQSKRREPILSRRRPECRKCTFLENFLNIWDIRAQRKLTRPARPTLRKELGLRWRHGGGKGRRTLQKLAQFFIFKLERRSFFLISRISSGIRKFGSLRDPFVVSCPDFSKHNFYPPPSNE